MSQEIKIQLFDTSKIRVVWDDEEEKYYFSVVDVVGALTESADYQLARNYWKVLKHRLIKEGNETVTNCNQLKLPAPDGKMRLTDVADLEGIFRIVQSIPSKKAEPLKCWLAEQGRIRFEQLQDPELSIEQAVADYRRLGYSEAWINQRIRSIETRKELTDEWKRGGMHEGQEFAALTDILTQAWSGLKTKEYKQKKGLRKESLRDNMTNVELALNTLAEASATELSQQRNPKGFKANAAVAREGGKVANVARKQLEESLGRSVVTSQRASDYIHPIEEGKAQELPFDDDTDNNN
ncbi:MAG: Bro-N domain-containing protein [Bacteroidales bacterium]|nr:Bro-N domain-containing protein [Bacteroidales bacterium]